MLGKVFGGQATGLNADIISVEVDISKGLHNFNIIGLPDRAVEEARDRVSSGLKNSDFDSPKKKNYKIIVSLAPAEIKKEGANFDLPITIGYLLALGEIVFNTREYMFIGEMSLDGTLYPVKGVLPIIKKAKEKGFKEVILPLRNVKEASLIEGINIRGAKNLKEVISHLRGEIEIDKVMGEELSQSDGEFSVIFEDIKGQMYAKRGLEIAAAGGHNISFYGPPGTGKTLLAKSLISILPPLTYDEIIDATSIYSVCGLLDNSALTAPPFRSPHHTSSYTSIVGGGTYPKPGEISLAHKGVLFLDEFPEFDKRVIESLREPLEEKTIRIARSKGSETFPADCIIVIAMNPEPDENQRMDYRKEMALQKKISGPVIDRIDMWVRVDAVDIDVLSQKRKDDSITKKIRQNVLNARMLQKERYEKEKGMTKNSDLSARNIDMYANLSKEGEKVLKDAVTRLSLSPRTYHRLIKIGRTIADLDKSTNIEEKHILEAVQYKRK